MSADEVTRLTPTQRLHEVTMAAMGRRAAEPESSVTLTRNAKGVAQFEREPFACRALVESLTDAEYAYCIGKSGESFFERAYGVRYQR